MKENYLTTKRAGNARVDWLFIGSNTRQDTPKPTRQKLVSVLKEKNSVPATERIKTPRPLMLIDSDTDDSLNNLQDQENGDRNVVHYPQSEKRFG